MAWTDDMALATLRADLYMATFRYHQRSTHKDAIVTYDSSTNQVLIGPVVTPPGFMTLAFWSFLLFPARSGGLGI